MEKIEVPYENDSFSTYIIDGEAFLLRFTYNSKHDYWSFGLYTTDRLPIIASVKIVRNFPLHYFYEDSFLPKGQFYATCEKEEIGHDSFKNGDAEFYYISYDDMLYAAGEL